MEPNEARAAIFGTVFTLSNKLQLLGDRLDPELTVKQWLFLAGVMRCEHGSPALSEIAARIGSSRQNVKKMAAILQKQGFVELNRDPADARVLRVSPTDACRAHLRGREAMEARFIEELFSGFSAGELTALADLIQKLERSAGEMGGLRDAEEA